MALINRESLLEKIQFRIEPQGIVGETVRDMVEKTREIIMAEPTVEVAHGEWVITEDDYLSLVEMKCSVCGESYGFEWFEDIQPKSYHYCPNCGAKMDGDGNG